VQEDRGQTGGAGENAGQTTGLEAEETQRLMELLETIRAGAKQQIEEKEAAPTNPQNPEHQDIITRTKFELEKTKARLRHRDTQEIGISEGEKLSSQIDDLIAIDLKDIIVEKEFQNTRLIEEPFRPGEPNSEGQQLSDLKKSMASKGQITPIIVAMGPDKKFLLRAGFRRFKCAQELNWGKIRAIVLPRWTPSIDEYWFNLLENNVRKCLNTYEKAHAAKLLRDKFGIKQGVIAEKAGLSYNYLSKLLSCIDKLPEELLQQWKNGCNLSFNQWYTLSCFDHHNAIRTFRRLTGRPYLNEDERKQRDRIKRTKRGPAKIVRCIETFLNHLSALEIKKVTPSQQRMIYQRMCEHFLQSRSDIPNLYDPKRHAEYRRRQTVIERNGLNREIPEPSDLEPGMEIPTLEYDDHKPYRG
jgi:ParB/RepB/Spo0J family partition protein